MSEKYRGGGGLSIGQIFLYLALVTFGPPLLYHLWHIGDNHEARLPPSPDPLKGSATPAALVQEISHRIPEAQSKLQGLQNIMLIREWAPPVVAVLCMVLIIWLHIRKKRGHPVVMHRPLIVLAYLLPPAALAASIALTGLHGERIDGFIFVENTLRLMTNLNTAPGFVVPGDKVKVNLSYTPAVASIQHRHRFVRPEYSDLTVESSSGGRSELQPRVLQDSGSPTFDDLDGLSRVGGKEGTVEPTLTLQLPAMDSISDALLAGTMRGRMEFIRGGSEGPLRQSSDIRGAIRFWVSNKEEAHFAALATRLDQTYQGGWISMLFICLVEPVFLMLHWAIRSDAKKQQAKAQPA